MCLNRVPRQLLWLLGEGPASKRRHPGIASAKDSCAFILSLANPRRDQALSLCMSVCLLLRHHGRIPEKSARVRSKLAELCNRRCSRNRRPASVRSSSCQCVELSKVAPDTHAEHVYVCRYMLHTYLLGCVCVYILCVCVYAIVITNSTHNRRSRGSNAKAWAPREGFGPWEEHFQSLVMRSAQRDCNIPRFSLPARIGLTGAILTILQASMAYRRFHESSLRSLVSKSYAWLGTQRCTC